MEKLITKPNTSTRYLLHTLRKSYWLRKNLLCKVRYYLRQLWPISLWKHFFLDIHSILVTLKGLGNLLKTLFANIQFLIVFYALLLFPSICCSMYQSPPASYSSEMNNVNTTHFLFGFSSQEWLNTLPWLVILLILLLLLGYLIKLVHFDK